MKHPRMKRAVLWMLMICMTASLTGLYQPGAAAAQTAGEVVGYYAAWAPWRGYGPEQLDPHQFTQINYAFADINQATGKVVLADPQREKETLAGLTALRKKNPNLKIVLSIGGWDYSTYFSDVASTAARRETFAKSCLELILAHDLDGVGSGLGVSRLRGRRRHPPSPGPGELYTAAEGHSGGAGPAGAEGWPGVPPDHCRCYRRMVFKKH